MIFRSLEETCIFLTSGDVSLKRRESVYMYVCSRLEKDGRSGSLNEKKTSDVAFFSIYSLYAPRISRGK